MPSIRANGYDFEVEDLGPKSAPPVVLIMGLAAQMTFWPPSLLEALLAAGFRVVRFDNRDIGLSAKLHGRRAPHPLLHVAARAIGFKNLAPYTLHDMVADTAGIMDALKIERAHLVGVSMGGMIAQLMAGTKPERVASLTSIMSGTLNPRLPRPSTKITRALFLNQPRGKSREALIERSVQMYSLIRTPDPLTDESELRAKMSDAYDRSYEPAGVRRQLAAIIATGDFRSVLQKIAAPTLVIHGAADPLAPVEAGRDSARNIKGAKLEIIEDMAHDLPKKHLAHIASLIIDQVKSAAPAARKRKAETA
jgi:pimeloyl-ACP methyl ester carboxylesterase